MATAAPPRDPFRSPLAEAMRAQARRTVAAGPARPELVAPAIRLVCVLATGAYALRLWLALLERPPRGAVAVTVVVAAIAGVALLALSRVARRAVRVAATAAVLGAALVGVLAAAG